MAKTAFHLKRRLYFIGSCVAFVAAALLWMWAADDGPVKPSIARAARPIPTASMNKATVLNVASGVRRTKLKGRVSDERGHRISGAEVCWWPGDLRELARASENLGECLTTDSSGVFAGHIAEATVLTFTASAEGFEDTITQLSTAALDSLALVLRVGASLRGKVVDAYGGVVSNAGVSVFQVDGSPKPPHDRGTGAAAMTVTNADGEFRIGLADGQFEVYAGASGYAVSQVTAIVPGPRIRLALAPEARVSGVVVDEASSPVPDVSVWARRDGWLGELYRTVTDAAGLFTLSAVSTGSYTIGIEAPNWDAAAVHAEVDSGMDTTDVRVVASRATFLEGRVTIGAEPCTRGEVMMQGPVVRGAETGAGGSVELSGLKAGTYEVTARCEGALALRETIEVSLDDAKRITRAWRLDKGRAIRGTISS